MKLSQLAILLSLGLPLPTYALAGSVSVDSYFDRVVLEELGLLVHQVEARRQVDFQLPGFDWTEIPCTGFLKVDDKGLPKGFRFTCKKR